MSQRAAPTARSPCRKPRFETRCRLSTHSACRHLSTSANENEPPDRTFTVPEIPVPTPLEPVTTPPDNTVSTPPLATSTSLVTVPPMLALPPFDTVKSCAMPPDDTLSLPPLSTSANENEPPDSTFTVPPLDTVVPLAVPPDETISVPLSTVPLAVPPANTISLPPLTVAPLSVPPDRTSALTPLPTVVARRGAVIAQLERDAGADRHPTDEAT